MTQKLAEHENVLNIDRAQDIRNALSELGCETIRHNYLIKIDPNVEESRRARYHVGCEAAGEGLLCAAYINGVASCPLKIPTEKLVAIFQEYSQSS
jgi:hypothetical protein